jgi:hypothetical protein
MAKKRKKRVAAKTGQQGGTAQDSRGDPLEESVMKYMAIIGMIIPPLKRTTIYSPPKENNADEGPSAEASNKLHCPNLPQCAHCPVMALVRASAAEK